MAGDLAVVRTGDLRGLVGQELDCFVPLAGQD